MERREDIVNLSLFTQLAAKKGRSSFPIEFVVDKTNGLIFKEFVAGQKCNFAASPAADEDSQAQEAAMGFKVFPDQLRPSSPSLRLF
jgi:hypothetical protein